MKYICETRANSRVDMCVSLTVDTLNVKRDIFVGNYLSSWFDSSLSQRKTQNCETIPIQNKLLSKTILISIGIRFHDSLNRQS